MYDLCVREEQRLLVRVKSCLQANIFLKCRIVRLYDKGVVYEQKHFYQLVISRPSHKSNR